LADQDGLVGSTTNDLDEAKLACRAFNDLGGVSSFGVKVRVMDWGSGRDDVVAVHSGTKCFRSKFDRGR
jgi:hypothetical protein